MLNLRFTAGVGVGISGACELPLAWRYPGHSGRRPPSLSASLCRAPPPLSSSSGTEPLTAPPEDAAFSSLFCLFSISSFLSAFACSFEVTVTSVSLLPFVSRRGLSNTNQRLSPVASVWDGACVCASVIVQDIKCCGYHNPTLETFSLSSPSSDMASPGHDNACARSCSGCALPQSATQCASSLKRTYSPSPLRALVWRRWAVGPLLKRETEHL